MNITIDEIREKYPQYSNKSDIELADAIHQKYYSSLPKEEIYEKLGVSHEDPKKEGIYENYVKPALHYEAGLGAGIGEGLINALSSIGNLAPEAYESFTGNKTGRIPKVDFSKYLPETTAAKIGHTIGNPIGQFGAPAGAIFKGSKTAINAVPYAKNLPEILKNILASGATGSALSEGERTKGFTVGGAIPVAAKPIGKVVDFFKKPNVIAKEIAPLEEKIEKTKKVQDRAKERMEIFKEKLASSPVYGSDKISTLKRTAAEKSNKLKELEPLTKIKQQEVPEIPPAPNVKELRSEAKDAIDIAKESLSTALGEGKPHHLIAGEIFDKELNAIRKDASSQINEAEKSFQNKPVIIKDNEQINKVKKEINRLQAESEFLPGYDFESPEIKPLIEQLNKLNEGEVLSSDDLFRSWDSANKLAANTRGKAFEINEKLTKEQRKTYKNIASSYEDIANEIESQLKTVATSEDFEKLAKAKKAWSAYASTYKNPVALSAVFNTKIPPNTMDKLLGKRKGNKVLNEIVEKSPTLRKAIFAHEYASPSAHKKLLRPNDVVDSYLNNLPEVKSKVQDLRNAHLEYKDKLKEIDSLSNEHKELKKSLTEMANQQATRQKAIQESSALVEQINKRNKAAKILEKQRDKAKARGENIEQMTKELENMKAESVQLKKKLQKVLDSMAKVGGVKYLMDKII